MVLIPRRGVDIGLGVMVLDVHTKHVPYSIRIYDQTRIGR